MYSTTKPLTDFHPAFPMENLFFLEHVLFLDIETTGLKASHSKLYMIGIAFYKDGTWFIEQRMTEDSSEESSLLLWLSERLLAFTHILTFNGNRFDLPFLIERARRYDVSLPLDLLESVDIYKLIKPFKELLVLPDCRQKTIEEFLGINRVDKYSGGELIQIYQSYELSHNKEMLDLLLLHNFDDMQGMLHILSIISYHQLLHTEVTVSKVELQRTKTVYDTDTLVLLMKLSLPFHVPKKLFAHYDGNYISITDNQALLRVPVYEEELKFFYANYKDYYYIPSMDSAFHKTIGAQIDPSLRIKATAENCYTKKQGFYLKQYTTLVEPFFKAAYKDNYSYFEITEETKTNRNLFNKYGTHLLQTILKQNM